MSSEERLKKKKKQIERVESNARAVLARHDLTEAAKIVFASKEWKEKSGLRKISTSGTPRIPTEYLRLETVVFRAGHQKMLSDSNVNFLRDHLDKIKTLFDLQPFEVPPREVPVTELKDQRETRRCQVVKTGKINSKTGRMTMKVIPQGVYGPIEFRGSINVNNWNFIPHEGCVIDLCAVFNNDKKTFSKVKEQPSG